MPFILSNVAVGIVVMIISYYWYKKQQNVTAFAKLVKGSRNIEEEDSNLQDGNSDDDDTLQPQPAPTKKSKPKTHSATTKKSKNKHQIPSDPHFLRRYGGHSGTVTSFAASPDGQWLATAGTDGQIRVAKVDEAGFNLSAMVKTPGTGVFQDHLSAISWLSSSDNNPTIVGAINKSREIAYYRIRRRKNATAKASGSNSSSQYELIELVKRRFDISSKVDEVNRVDVCLADQSHDSKNNCIILTKTEYDPKRPQLKHPNTVAWNGDDGATSAAAGTVNTNSPGIRLSPDGAFLSGRGGIGAPEAKIFEVRRKKVKGVVEPVFDSISSKGVMTLVPATTGAKVADVAFCGESDNLKLHHVSLGIVGCDDGSVEVWDLDVDYKVGADPRFLASVRLCGGGGVAGEKKVICVAASVAVSSVGNDGQRDGNASLYRIAVATSDSALHLLSYNIETTSLSVDFSIEDSAHKEGVGELQFCPSSGHFLYSTGKNNSKEVFSWKIS